MALVNQRIAPVGRIAILAEFVPQKLAMRGRWLAANLDGGPEGALCVREVPDGPAEP